MLEPSLLRNNLELVASKLIRRKFKLDIDMLRKQEKLRKMLQIETETLQAERNIRSKNIAIAKFRGENIDSMCKEMDILNKRLSFSKIKLNSLQNKINNYMLSLPNIPDDQVPDGHDENDNIEVFRWGEPRQYDFPIRDHVELGSLVKGLDFSTAAELAGSRFVIMSDKIALLHRALSQFMLDLHTIQHGYQEYYVPYIVNHSSMYGAGQLPKFTKDLFHLKSLNKKLKINSYALIPTAEVPLINLMRNKIISEDKLPVKMTAHTPCFRSEINSYGRDIRGLVRMHQFDKVEIVQIVKPERSMQALEDITNHAEKVLQLLKLPYRKILLCAGDIGFTSCKTYDLEVWLPAQNIYREISSCSNIGDFQARRMQIRFYEKYKKTRLLHTLNGSGLAVGRTLMAVMENYQLSDGRIEVPLVLQSYMKGLTYIS